MLQQTLVDKNVRRFGLLSRFFQDSTEKRELNRDIKFLGDDYTAIVKIAANLSSHVKWIPYPFLLNRIKKIAEELRALGEVLRYKMSELGGQVAQVSAESRELHDFRQNVKRLVGDMEEHAALCEALVHQKNLIKDPGVLKVVDAVARDMQKQKDELLDIVMRVS